MTNEKRKLGLHNDDRISFYSSDIPRENECILKEDVGET